MIRAQVTGHEKVIELLGKFPAQCEGALRTAMREAMRDLHAHVVRDKLSGQVLKRVSGDLSRSVQWRVDDVDGAIVGRVGANTPYAARQEYGFRGTETVREYVRRSRAQMATAKYNKLGNETRPSKAGAKGAGAVVVRSHSRNIDYKPHSYLRSALADMRADIIGGLVVAARKAIL